MNDTLHLGHQEMYAARTRGEATTLTPTITWLARHRDAWWVVDEDGWRKVTDPLTVSEIDQVTTRLAARKE